MAASYLRILPGPEMAEVVQNYPLLPTDRNGWSGVATDGEKMWVEVEIITIQVRKTESGLLLRAARYWLYGWRGILTCLNIPLGLPFPAANRQASGSLVAQRDPP